MQHEVAGGGFFGGFIDLFGCAELVSWFFPGGRAKGGKEEQGGKGAKRGGGDGPWHRCR